MGQKRQKSDVEIDAFKLLREMDETLEYVERRIFHMRRKNKELMDELITHRPDFIGD